MLNTHHTNEMLTRLVRASGLLALILVLTGLAGAAQAQAEFTVQHTHFSGARINVEKVRNLGDSTVNVSMLDDQHYRIDANGEELVRKGAGQLDEPCTTLTTNPEGKISAMSCPRDTSGVNVVFLNGNGPADGNNTLNTDPNFPDHVRGIGGRGNDTLLGGAGDDTIRDGAGTNTIVGNLGNDRLSNDGGKGVIDARDRVRDSNIECDHFQRRLGTHVIVDLQDDDFLAGCIDIDRSNKNEGPNVKISTSKPKVAHDGSTKLTLKCPRKLSRSCKGTLKLAEFGKSAAGKSSYSIKPGKSATVKVELSDKLAGKARRRALDVLATSTEKGQFGTKTASRGVKLG